MNKASKIFPVFAVRDIDEALNFYVEKLGFSIAWTWGEPAHRAGVAFNGIEIQLDSESAGTDGASVVYIHMDDVTSYFTDCRARGVQFIYELGDRPWGTMDFRVADPSGNRLGFASVRQ
jgi:uncharacterized glyoxalase superfamily protein PhnB